VNVAKLRIEYIASVRWADPILTAIQSKRALARKHRGWRRSELSDLTFAIERRLEYLPEITRWIDESLALIGPTLPDRVGAAEYLQPVDPVAFRIADRRVLQRLLIGVSSFIAESRSCFETLARFHAAFLRRYCEEGHSLKSSYEAVKHLGRPYGWVRRLKQLRDDLIHERAPWIEFDADNSRRPAYELVVVLDWRPEVTTRRSRVPIQDLREIRDGLRRAAGALQRRLVRRIRAM
jgi:hypothetical protein